MGETGEAPEASHAGVRRHKESKRPCLKQSTRQGQTLRVNLLTSKCVLWHSWNPMCARAHVRTHTHHTHKYTHVEKKQELVKYRKILNPKLWHITYIFWEYFYVFIQKGMVGKLSLKSFKNIFKKIEPSGGLERYLNVSVGTTPQGLQSRREPYAAVCASSTQTRAGVCLCCSRNQQTTGRWWSSCSSCPGLK